MIVYEFELGKWYRYIGPCRRQETWNKSGEMDFILTGKPYKWVLNTSNGLGYFLYFHDKKNNTCWSWDTSLKAGYFEEVSEEEALKEKLAFLKQEFSVIKIIKRLLFEERY